VELSVHDKPNVLAITISHGTTTTPLTTKTVKPLAAGDVVSFNTIKLRLDRSGGNFQAGLLEHLRSTAGSALVALDALQPQVDAVQAEMAKLSQHIHSMYRKRFSSWFLTHFWCIAFAELYDGSLRAEETRESVARAVVLRSRVEQDVAKLGKLSTHALELVLLDKAKVCTNYYHRERERASWIASETDTLSSTLSFLQELDSAKRDLEAVQKELQDATASRTAHSIVNDKLLQAESELVRLTQLLAEERQRPSHSVDATAKHSSGGISTLPIPAATITMAVQSTQRLSPQQIIEQIRQEKGVGIEVAGTLLQIAFSLNHLL
jgi:hypothetical protein